MGGIYPQSTLFSEFNFNCGMGLMDTELYECEGSARTSVQLMPPETKLVFLGFEAGLQVMSGGALTSCASEDNPCRRAYITYCGEGNNRSSWDPMTLVAAVRGAAGISCQETGNDGRNEVEYDGNNFWLEEAVGGSNQTYLLLNDGEAAGQLLDSLLCMT